MSPRGRWSRLVLPAALGMALLLGVGGCQRPSSPLARSSSSPAPSPSPLSATPQPPQAKEQAVAFLLKARSADGGWHSGKYRDMAEGPELTPPVLKALTYAGVPEAERELSLAYLEAQSPDSGSWIYPVYSSAGMLMLGVDEARRWKQYLLEFQADERLGWTPEDLSYGGWSYAMEPPKKLGGEVPTLSQANLPSTLFALGGLALSEGGLPEETAQKALRFVERCQNFPGDGGFCASPTDPSMNKAGDHLSYGSATSDGLRALLRCGLKPDHPRVVAARAWLEKNLSSRVHPGSFPEGRSFDRDSLYFYYCWSTAHALAALQRAGAPLSEQERAWCREVRQSLETLQKDDGSWSNPAAATREDDPLVATPLVLAVLVLTETLSP